MYLHILSLAQASESVMFQGGPTLGGPLQLIACPLILNSPPNIRTITKSSQVSTSSPQN